jgi:integrase
VAAVIRRYEADGYPGKRGGKRNAGKHCDGEEARCKVLAEYFNGTAAAEDLDQDGLDAYRTWRCAKVAEGKVKLDGNQSKPKGAGDRTTDLDLNCLNNAYRWGLRKKLIKTNPIEKRAKYHAPSEVTHCREYAPESPEELHAAAGVLFSSRRSESLGWQLLVEGMTGLRSDEAVHLRMNARATEAGGLTPDGRNMCVRRAKKSSKFNVNVRVHPGLDAVLAAHRIWHAARYPLSPWYFPGRNRLALKHTDKSALTHALNHLFQKGKLLRKYTSHGGGRAFYVYARRSQGADDPQICYEINHVGGVGTLEQVYALPAKHWQNGEAPGMDWLPKGAPAWSKIKKVDFSSLDRAAALEFEI